MSIQIALMHVALAGLCAVYLMFFGACLYWLGYKPAKNWWERRRAFRAFINAGRALDEVEFNRAFSDD